MSLLLDSILQNSELQLCVGYTTNVDDDEYSLYNKVLQKQSLSLFDKHYVVSKNLWVNDEILSQYPSSNSHYVADNKVYLCLQNNNNSMSIVKPTNTSIFNFMTSDGYVWRYLFTLQTDDHIDYVRVSSNLKKPSIKHAIARLQDYNSALTFNTKPVVKIVSETGGSAVIDFDYVDMAVKNVMVSAGGTFYKDTDYVMITEDILGDGASVDFSIIDGAIVVNSFVAGGNYIEPKIHIIGDGTGAVIDNNVANGSLTSVEVVNGGTNYTWAKVIIAPSINSHVSRIILESPNGFGYEPKDDIVGSELMIAKAFNVDIDTNINFVLITNKSLSNEYPSIYAVNNINNKTLSNNSDNLIQVIIDEAI